MRDFTGKCVVCECVWVCVCVCGCVCSLRVCVRVYCSAPESPVVEPASVSPHGYAVAVPARPAPQSARSRGSARGHLPLPPSSRPASAAPLPDLQVTIVNEARTVTLHNRNGPVTFLCRYGPRVRSKQDFQVDNQPRAACIGRKHLSQSANAPVSKCPSRTMSELKIFFIRG